VGVTGAPGAGKSTLVDAMITRWRKAGKSVGVIAVDPSSPFSGGAMLGDRVRMQAHAQDAGVFIRSMATRGQLGGLARATTDAALVLDAAGKDYVAIETVGVGQDEVDVMRTVDVVAVVTVPGLGDEIQAIKAGIMEIADVFVVNKADRPGVERAVRDLQFALELAEESRRDTPIVQTVANRDQGVDELRDRLDRCRERLQASAELARRRFEHLRLRVETLLERRILSAARESLDLESELQEAARRKEDPYSVADRIFSRVVSAR
jgi:LAO/AO transport system kinase